MLPFGLEEERVRKLLLLFKRMMLQIRGVSMHSGLEDQRRMIRIMIIVSSCVSLAECVLFEWGVWLVDGIEIHRTMLHVYCVFKSC